MHHQDLKSISTSHTNFSFKKSNVHQSQSALSPQGDLRQRRFNTSYDDDEEQQANLAFADESCSLMSDNDLIVPVIGGLQSRQSSYTSHLSRLSYSSHSDMPFKVDLDTADQKISSPSKDFDEQTIHNQTSLFLNEVRLDE